MCKIDNCNIRPTFNFEGESKALYCSAHKKDEWTQRLLYSFTMTVLNPIVFFI